jgi:hypothetical protein
VHHILRGLPLTTPVETVLNRSSENPVSDTINLIARLVDMVQTRIGGGGRMTNFGFHTGASAHYLSVIEHRLAARSSEDRKTAFGQSVFNNSSRTSC